MCYNMNVLYCFIILGGFCAFGDENQSSSCITPNGESALCVSFRLCRIFKEALYSEDPLVTNFTDASLSACGDGGTKICCGTFAKYANISESGNSTVDEEKIPIKSKKEHAIEKLLPSRKFCGMQHRDEYFLKDTKISVDEFPWMVLVYYEDEERRIKRSVIQNSAVNPYAGCSFVDLPLESLCRTYNSHPVYIPKVTYKCTGVLISPRYALTSNSCASGTSMKVALGQFEENKDVGCSPTPFGDYCTYPVINATVTKQIRSPNDSLLLLRLEEKIQYTDFIRPICLPMNETIRPKINDVVATSGWGYESTNENATVVKKRIMQNITSNAICKEEASSPNHLCTTLGDQTNVVCKSDRGGPLMYRYTHKNWYVEGIVDTNRCVNDTVHSVRLTPALVDWILENMED